MTSEERCFDGDLAVLDASLRRGERDAARLRLAAFELLLSGYIRGEERVVFPALARVSAALRAPIARMRCEHDSLRRLVAEVWEALHRSDLRRARTLIDDLRSVLVLHVAKEDWLLAAAACAWGSPERSESSRVACWPA